MDAVLPEASAMRCKTVTMVDPPTASQVAQGAEPASDEVRALLAEGREQGCLTAEHVAETHLDLDLSPDQIESIFMCLTDEGIEIIEGDDLAAADATGVDARQQAPTLDLSFNTSNLAPGIAAAYARP